MNGENTVVLTPAEQIAALQADRAAINETIDFHVKGFKAAQEIKKDIRARMKELGVIISENRRSERDAKLTAQIAILEAKRAARAK
jgi:hypothetical protein